MLCRNLETVRAKRLISSPGNQLGFPKGKTPVFVLLCFFCYFLFCFNKNHKAFWRGTLRITLELSTEEAREGGSGPVWQKVGQQLDSKQWGDRVTTKNPIPWCNLWRAHTHKHDILILAVAPQYSLYQKPAKFKSYWQPRSRAGLWATGSHILPTSVALPLSAGVWHLAERTIEPWNPSPSLQTFLDIPSEPLTLSWKFPLFSRVVRN